MVLRDGELNQHVIKIKIGDGLLYDSWSRNTDNGIERFEASLRIENYSKLAIGLKDGKVIMKTKKRPVNHSEEQMKEKENDDPKPNIPGNRTEGRVPYTIHTDQVAGSSSGLENKRKFVKNVDKFIDENFPKRIKNIKYHQ